MNLRKWLLYPALFAAGSLVIFSGILLIIIIKGRPSTAAPPVATYVYSRAADGRLVCIGRGIGFGAGWRARRAVTRIQILDRGTWRLQEVHFSPTLVVAPFNLAGPAVAVPCL